MKLENKIKQDLLQKAREAAEQAYAPYSGFYVGAALLAEDGSIYTGCNVENASFGAGICAERNALFHAISEGKRRFTAIAVTGGTKKEESIGFCEICYPCGICLQALSEFCGDEFLFLFGTEERTMKEMLPHGFGAAAFQKE